MNIGLQSKVIDNRRFVVDYDESYIIHEEFFENNQDKLEFIKRFQKGELSAYKVFEQEKCPCCNEWRHVDSLFSIVSEDSTEALNVYMECRE